MWFGPVDSGADQQAFMPSKEINMRKILGVVLTCTLLLLWTGVAQTGGDDDPRAVIKKAISAIGDEAKLAKYQAATVEEKGTYYGMGGGLPYTGKYAFHWPDKFRMEIQGVFTIVLNGDKGWINAGGEIKEMAKEQLAQQRNDHRAGWISTLVPLKDKAFQLKNLDDAKVDGKSARVVQVSRKGYPTVKLFFDSKSNLLVKNEYRSTAAEMKFKEVTMETYFSDYRDAGGVKHAHKVVLKRDGKLFVEAEMSEVKAFEKLDAKTFERPGN